MEWSDRLIDIVKSIELPKGIELVYSKPQLAYQDVRKQNPSGKGSKYVGRVRAQEDDYVMIYIVRESTLEYLQEPIHRSGEHNNWDGYIRRLRVYAEWLAEQQ